PTDQFVELGIFGDLTRREQPTMLFVRIGTYSTLRRAAPREQVIACAEPLLVPRGRQLTVPSSQFCREDPFAARIEQGDVEFWCDLGIRNVDTHGDAADHLHAVEMEREKTCTVRQDHIPITTADGKTQTASVVIFDARSANQRRRWDHFHSRCGWL